MLACSTFFANRLSVHLRITNAVARLSGNSLGSLIHGYWVTVLRCSPTSGSSHVCRGGSHPSTCQIDFQATGGVVPLWGDVLYIHNQSGLLPWVIGSHLFPYDRTGEWHHPGQPPWCQPWSFEYRVLRSTRYCQQYQLRWYRRLNWPFLTIFLNVRNIINIHWIRSRFSGWSALSKRIGQALVECKESEEHGLIINHRLGGNFRFLVSNSISQFDIFTKWTWLKSKLFHRSTSQKT